MKIVIVGAGIVGTSTAFYVAHHPKFDPSRDEIIVVEAVHPACAASGKAGGLLSSTAFPKQIANMSFQLHEELANAYGGESNWGYRKVMTCSVEASLQSPKNNTARIPSDLDWIDRDFIGYCEVLGEPGQFAQVHPFHFTNFLMNKLVSEGKAKLITGRVDKIHGTKEQGASGISYIDQTTGEHHRIDADRVVVTTGPWTSKLIENCPIYCQKVQSITVEPLRPVSAYALFTELQIDRYKRVSPEIYARQDEIYICGESTTEPLPITADLVEVSEEAATALYHYGSVFAPDVIKGGKMRVSQACYLPIVEDSSPCPGPFLGETNVQSLYVAAGHSCWGINNAPATGKLMSEIILDGKASSANVKPFAPADYFDASVVLSP